MKTRRLHTLARLCALAPWCSLVPAVGEGLPAPAASAAPTHDGAVICALSGRTITALTWNGHDFSSPDGGKTHPGEVAVFDRSTGGYRPLRPAALSLTTDSAGAAATFTLEVTNPGPQPITRLEVQLGRLCLPNAANPAGLGDHDGRGVSAAEPQCLPLSGLFGQCWIVNLDAAVHPLAFQLGSKYWSAWPLSVTDRTPLLPDEARTYRIALRFGTSSQPTARVCADIYQTWSAANGPLLRHLDRRPVGCLMFSSVGRGWTQNPSGWLNDPQIDTRTKSGRAAASQKLFATFKSALRICLNQNAQAVILWDIEGSSRPRAHYVGDPRQVAALAPEMDAILDAGIALFASAGIRPGFCIRDARLMTPAEGHDFVQRPYADEAERLADLSAKLDYLVKRFGPKLWIYLDSWAGTSATLETLVRRVPLTVISPEQMYPGVPIYRFAAPYLGTSRFRTGTSPDTRKLVPGAFSLLDLSNITDPARREAVRVSVAQGDVPLFRAWWTGGSDFPLLKESMAARATARVAGP